MNRGHADYYPALAELKIVFARYDTFATNKKIARRDDAPVSIVHGCIYALHGRPNIGIRQYSKNGACTEISLSDKNSVHLQLQRILCSSWHFMQT